MEIEVRRSKSDKNPVKVTYDFGSNVLEAMRHFNSDGPYGDVVHNLFVKAATLQLREFVTEQLEAGKTVEQVQFMLEGDDIAAGWKPTIKHKGTPPTDKAAQLLGDLQLSDEERQALIERLQAGNLPPPKEKKPREPKAPKKATPAAPRTGGRRAA